MESICIKKKYLPFDLSEFILQVRLILGDPSAKYFPCFSVKYSTKPLKELNFHFSVKIIRMFLIL